MWTPVVSMGEHQKLHMGRKNITKTIRRLFCVALAVSMLCASALAEIKLIPESATMYLNSRNGKSLTATRDIRTSRR